MVVKGCVLVEFEFQLHDNLFNKPHPNLYTHLLDLYNHNNNVNNNNNNNINNNNSVTNNKDANINNISNNCYNNIKTIIIFITTIGLLLNLDIYIKILALKFLLHKFMGIKFY